MAKEYEITGDMLYVKMYRYPLEESERKCSIIYGNAKGEYISRTVHISVSALTRQTYETSDESELKIIPESDFVIVHCYTTKKLYEDSKYTGTKYRSELFVYEKGKGWNYIKLIEDILRA